MRTIKGLLMAKTEEEFDYWFEKMDKAITKVTPWILGFGAVYMGIHFIMFLIRIWS